MINWKIRLKNKNFWLAIVPAVLLLVQAIVSVLATRTKETINSSYTPSGTVSQPTFMGSAGTVTVS